jgi:tetratricopeptide (TPR) repeat protein
MNMSARATLPLLILAAVLLLPYWLQAQCSPRKADAQFAHGMAFARSRQWQQARDALQAGERLCPDQKRFPEELAGVAFEQKQYPQAAHWLRRALHIAPDDRYVNNFAGTVYYLMGNLPAALMYWNRVNRPQIHELNIHPNLRIRPLILGRAFSFSPQSVLTRQQYETTEARLHGLGIFPAYRITLSPLPDGSFNADFHALEQNGFGDGRLQAALSLLSGLPYQTIYPVYSNIDRSAINVTSLLRWDSQKRRAWINVSGPLHDLPQRRWQITVDARNENWAIRRSFTGDAPVLGSLNLQKQAAAFSITDIASGRWQWSTGAELSHRSYRNVQDGSALNPGIVLPGNELKYLLSITGKPIDLPQHRFTVTTYARSQTARLWSQPSHVFEKLEGSARLRWSPVPNSNRWQITQQVRGGGLIGASPFDELFMLGVERDNNLWMRGNIGDRDGRKGSAPLGTSYLLSNSDVYRRLYSNGLIGIQAGPLFDIGRMAAPTHGLASNRWMFDTGLEARITVLGTRVLLTWGYDLRTGNNAIFGTAQ